MLAGIFLPINFQIVKERRPTTVTYPYETKSALAEALGLSKSTVQQRCGEMEASGRYGKFVTIRDGQILLINSLAFLDWMKYRRAWNDRNLKKYVPPYDPKEVAAAMAWEPVFVNLKKPKGVA